jgi:hypothetical protein
MLFAKWILKPFPTRKLREALASYLKGWVAALKMEDGYGWIPDSRQSTLW